MAMGRRRKGRQRELFVAASEVRALGNPFHRALNRLLDEHGFDEFAEAACREFYAEKRGLPRSTRRPAPCCAARTDSSC